MSSLKYFKVEEETTFMSTYLTAKKVPFKGTQLKFKVRTGVTGLGEDLMDIVKIVENLKVIKTLLINAMRTVFHING